ncbi:OsmC family peroxiredoxin [Hymenobacter terricola]|uniref:OsmC family peroxiredoxin n=1 Tax=Hymenobacter terricola TaxID=2819236 RepID=UPI001B30F1F0|nr:OsmC family peroxiredoxin [Hymenobacter terricola]
MQRHATAYWNGSGKVGRGGICTQSTFLQDAHYSYNSRFGAAPATNSEELLAAAHAMRFALKLRFVLEAAGYLPDSLETTATVSFETGAITTSSLSLKARIAGLEEAAFAACVEEAAQHSPISKVLNAKISVKSYLER